MSQTNNNQAGSGRRPKSLPSRLPEDVYNTSMRDLLEFKPFSRDEEWDTDWSAALTRLWHQEFEGKAGYTQELIPNITRCIRTRTLDHPNPPVYVAVGIVQELSLSHVLSAIMRAPYSETKVKAAVDKWVPIGETAEEQAEEDGDWVASSKLTGISADGMQPSTSQVKSKTTTSSLRRGIRRPDLVIRVRCRHIGGSKSTSVPLTIEIKAFPLNDSGHPQSELKAGKAFVRGLSQTAMYTLAGWEMFRCRRGLFICGPTFCRVFVLDDTALAVEVASPPASLSALILYPLCPLSCRLLESFVRGVVERTLSQTVGEALGCQTEEMNFDSLSASHPDMALGMLNPSSDRLDLVRHARESTVISKAASSGAGRKKKATSRKGPYLEARGNRKDRGGGGGGSGGRGSGGRSGRSGWGGRRVQNRGARGGHASEKRGGDGGTGSGPCDEGDGDTSTKRSHNLSADHDRDQFIDALGAPPEAEGVGWKGSGWLTQAERYNWLNDWLEALPQAEKPIDITNNGISPSPRPSKTY
ncbi:hypothetical protein I308_101618 [Cryptococcus tetragattii IND107]|uniref:Uncharacterized protein n=1 Tax=Cryptococcus tetragattii IND107 TaxID=1296105 RepID=A0ABR3C0T5_9TREE